MNEFDWIIGYRFQSLIKREFDWIIRFENDVTLVVGCLWRLIVAGRVKLTSEDHGQQFGLPEPIDAAVGVNSCLAGTTVQSISLVEGLFDLEFKFESGDSFQVIPDSSGYEAWELNGNDSTFVAVGGGEIAISS